MFPTEILFSFYDVNTVSISCFILYFSHACLFTNTVCVIPNSRVFAFLLLCSSCLPFSLSLAGLYLFFLTIVFPHHSLLQTRQQLCHFYAAITSTFSRHFPHTPYSYRPADFPVTFSGYSRPFLFSVLL